MTATGLDGTIIADKHDHFTKLHKVLNNVLFNAIQLCLTNKYKRFHFICTAPSCLNMMWPCHFVIHVQFINEFLDELHCSNIFSNAKIPMETCITNLSMTIYSDDIFKHKFMASNLMKYIIILV